MTGFSSTTPPSAISPGRGGSGGFKQPPVSGNLSVSANNAITNIAQTGINVGLDLVGGAVEGYLQKGLNKIGESIPFLSNLSGQVGAGLQEFHDPGNSKNSGRAQLQPANGTYNGVNYGSDMIEYAPKFRFLFKVRFVFNSPYNHAFSEEFCYVIKQMDRPTVNFEYDEVNMYNYRTKVLRTIKHDPLTITFHDDIKNKVLAFLNAYRTAYSPISNLGPPQKELFEVSGMNFPTPGSPLHYSGASGLLAANQINILSHIVLYQYFAHGGRANVFTFTNPKIESFQLDNLDMESSEGNSCTLNFSYDALAIDDEIVHGNPQPWGKQDILGNSERTPRLYTFNSGTQDYSNKDLASTFQISIDDALTPSPKSIINNALQDFGVSLLRSVSSTAVSAVAGSIGGLVGGVFGPTSKITNAVTNTVSKAGTYYAARASNSVLSKFKIP